MPSLKESVTTKIQFPSDDEETGLALIGYRGPKATVSKIANVSYQESLKQLWDIIFNRVEI